MPAYGHERTKEVFLAEAQRRRGKLVSFCRVGIAHHHGMSISCALSGNARPTLLQKYNCFSLRALRLRENKFLSLRSAKAQLQTVDLIEV